MMKTLALNREIGVPATRSKREGLSRRRYDWRHTGLQWRPPHPSATLPESRKDHCPSYPRQRMGTNPHWQRTTGNWQLAPV